MRTQERSPIEEGIENNIIVTEQRDAGTHVLMETLLSADKQNHERDEKKMAEFRKQLGTEQDKPVTAKTEEKPIKPMDQKAIAKQQKIYSTIAEVYDLGLSLIGYKRAARKFIAQIPLSSESQLTILDAGSGTGLYSFAAAERFPNARIVAFDFNEKMANKMQAIARSKGLQDQVRVTTGDVSKRIPGLDEQFDIVITGGVLEYVNLEEAVHNLGQYVKQGGYFLNSAVKDNFLGRTLGKFLAFQPYSQKENVSAFTENGLQLVNTADIAFPPKRSYLFQKA